MSRPINRVACQLPKMANATGCEFRPIFFEAPLLYSKGRVNATGNLHGLKLLPGEGPQSACVRPHAIPQYSTLFQAIPRYSTLFQAIPCYSTLFQKVLLPKIRFRPRKSRQTDLNSGLLNPFFGGSCPLPQKSLTT